MTEQNFQSFLAHLRREGESYSAERLANEAWVLINCGFDLEELAIVDARKPEKAQVVLASMIRPEKGLQN